MYRFNIESLPYLSTKRQQALESAGILSPLDLLFFFPRTYIDRSHVCLIRHLQPNHSPQTIIAFVRSARIVSARKKRIEVIVEDDSGTLKCVWFGAQKWIVKFLQPGTLLALFGKPKRYGFELSMAHPQYEVLKNPEDAEQFAGIVAVYPGSETFKKAGITLSLLRRWINYCLEHIRIYEFLPDSILHTWEIPTRELALQFLHHPKTLSQSQQAIRRFKLEELFVFQLILQRFRQHRLEKSKGFTLTETKPYTSAFFNNILPFSLTQGQIKALSEIKKDVQSGYQMNRLLQGDVGAGKTIVAIGAILLALDNGFQAALMAPTEILAEQHYKTLTTYLNQLNIDIRLLTGTRNSKARQEIETSLADGLCHLVIGTHAIIQNSIQFFNLGLLVIDEQHRFGVQQRASLYGKGHNPHVLVMSATPIPRSLAMTVYGDLDVSMIKGLPGGRKPIQTYVKSASKLEEVVRFLKTDILPKGQQAYVVYPLIEESAALDLSHATEGAAFFEKHLPDHNIGLLHGKLPGQQKEELMDSFVKGKIDVLVSTTVIEVGVDVPNATVMTIVHAERFGLSQLHQLRGRVGRGGNQSYCFLVAGVRMTKDAKERLRTMTETTDGFKIAEEDLKLRGPGDFLGTKQSGLPEFKVADIVADADLHEQAKRAAIGLLSDDPGLQKSNHKPLKDFVNEQFLKRKNFLTRI